MELKNAGFDIDSIDVPKRIYMLADDIYNEMVNRDCGIYKYPLDGAFVLKNNPKVDSIKGQMFSPGIATQAEDLVSGGVE